MTRDAALAKARTERERTTLPQLVGMRSDGDWYCHAVTGRKLTDLEDSARAWDQYELADARQRVEDEGRR